jgi:hypothetical protein
MRDLDVDVGFLPRLGLELAPFHVAIGRRLIVAEPPLKLVVLA